MVMRLEAGLRVGPTNDTLTVDFNGGGEVDVVLTHGLYTGINQVHQELTTQLTAVDASLSAGEHGGATRITWGSGPAVFTWPKAALRDWLGFTGTASGTSSVTGGQMPCVYQSGLPWATRRPLRWELRLQRARHPAGRARSALMTRWRLFEVDAVLRPSDLPAFRAVMRHLAGGTPGTLIRDTAESAYFDFSAWYGSSVVQLERGDYADGLERTAGQLGLCRIPLVFREVTP